MRYNKIKKKQICAGAILLAGVLAFSPAAVFAEAEENTAGDVSSYYEPKDHADMDYADMVYREVNPKALDEVLAELDAVTDGTADADAPEQRSVELYEEILRVMDTEYTNYVLGDIAHYKNVNDEDMADKNRRDMMAIQDMTDAAFLSLQKALTGPYGGKLREEFSERQLADLEEYSALTDRERELTDKETELQQDYDRISEEDYTFEYKGKTWTLDELYDDPPEDYDDIVAVYLGISKQMDEAIVPVFQDMIRIRREIAEEEGYDTYTDYCYDVNYARDFTGEEIAALRTTVRKELKPLYDELRMMRSLSLFDADLSEPMSGDEIVDEIAGHIGNIHPELTEAYDYMCEHGLYCIDRNADMIDAGFTSDLPEYGSAFIYDKINGTIHDLETLVHEFGHFNATYHARENVLTDCLLVDVAEIQSQGLEMLFLDEMQEILPEDPEGLQLYLLVNMLDSVLTGFEYDEFQQEVYASDDMTAEELNRLAMDIDRKYTEYFYDDDGEAYEWVLINHTFTSPLYYIGYATSALSALDIWSQSLEDRDAAVDKYMKLSAVPLDMPYQEAVTSCGLRNMLEPENIRALADEIREWVDSQGFGDFDDFGFPDLPFGDDWENPFEWAVPSTPSDPNPVLPYEYDPVPYGAEEDPDEYGTEPYGEEPYDYGNNPSYDQSSDMDEYMDEVVRQIMRVAGISTVAGLFVRVLVLIIALIAYFRKKKKNRTEWQDRWR